MKIKKYFINTTLFMIIVGFLCLVGCSRYEEGPGVSLRSVKSRIVNKWVIDFVYEEGVDITSSFKNTFKNWELDTESNHEYTLSFTTFIGSNVENGKWELLENGTKINLRKNGTDTNIWKLRRLTANELWATQEQSSGKTIEYRLKSK